MTEDSTNRTHYTPAELVRIEAEALEQLAQRLDGPQKETFELVAERLAEGVRSSRRAILTGVGKSGLIARKIAATLLSTGTPAQYMHPSDALHGDLGILTSGDTLIALSYSGESEEVLKLLAVVPKLGVTLISFCGNRESTLAAASSQVLDVSVEREACAHQLAPTASTTAMLALGDALAIEVMQRLNFKPRDFAELHPGGQIGRRLAIVRQLMKSGKAMPVVSPSAGMPQIMHEMSAKRLGMTTVQSNGKLLGMLSDGDLRRLLERNGPSAFHKRASDIMNPRVKTIAPGPLALDALVMMEQYKITALVVTEDGTQATPVLGVLHLHDLWEVAPQNTTEPDLAALEAAAAENAEEKPSEQTAEHYDPPSDDGRL